jgi:Holliday junction resolvase RusA-like endonuclease
MKFTLLRINFTVFGQAVPQGRPRAYRRGRFLGFYDPARSRAWKQDVRRQALAFRPARPVPGPLALEVRFILYRPKSLPKRLVQHIKKPDLDNFVKAVKDALKGLVYRDDSQIVRLAASKAYGDPPRVEIRIEELSHERADRDSKEVQETNAEGSCRR